jgi:hypothetical protein
MSLSLAGNKRRHRTLPTDLRLCGQHTESHPFFLLAGLLAASSFFKSLSLSLFNSTLAAFKIKCEHFWSPFLSFVDTLPKMIAMHIVAFLSFIEKQKN